MCIRAERHVVFPADHGPDSTDRRVENGHGRAVAKAPDQALGGGRHQLAMLAHQRPVRREEQDRAIERAAVTLDDADDDVGIRLAGRLTQSSVAGPGTSTELSQ